MSSEQKPRSRVLQGTLDLLVSLQPTGPLHAYGIASRLEQVSENLLKLNQGTLYPALVRLEQQRCIAGEWKKTENNREAKYYRITKAGVKALGDEAEHWRPMATLVDNVLAAEV